MGTKIKIFIVIFVLTILSFISYKLSGANKNNWKITSPIGKTLSVILSTKERKNQKYITYGFLPYWTLDRTQYIQTDRLTDIAYFALTINSDGSIKKVDDGGEPDPGYNNWNNNENLDNLIKKGAFDNTRFSLTIISHKDDNTREFLNCRMCWDKLLKETESEMEKKKIEHLNIDFELVEPDAEESLSLKYSQFVNFMNKSLDKKFGDSFVVVSTLPDSMNKPRLTHVESLASAADALFVMAYDFHKPNSKNAGPVAPINGEGSTYEYDVSTMLNDYIKIVGTNKLILGVPYYGYNWIVENDQPNAVRIPGNEFIGKSISQTYEYIMDVKLRHGLDEKWDSEAKSPYITYFSSENQTLRQIYFENQDSLLIKYNLAKDKDLMGIGIWALGYDGGYQELWDLLNIVFK